MRRETKLMHYGRSPTPGTANPSVMRASTILHDTVGTYRDAKRLRESDDTVLSYGRRGTTTAHALSEAIRDMEAADAAFLYPTGVAALATAISAFVGAGDHLLVVDTIFGATRRFCEKQLKRNGVKIDYFPWDTVDLAPWVKPETRAIVVESPASQTFEVMDVPAICANAKWHGLTVITDNTYGSSWLYQPLKQGCDVSVVAGTKYLGGHADLMMGAVSARGEACGPLRTLTHDIGQTLSPDDAYACLRGMRTLGLRMAHHGQASLAVAKWLLDSPEVVDVLHPGLEGHPGHEIWRRDANGCNGLLTVRFKPSFNADAFVDCLQLFFVGSSWGGFESLAMPVSPYQDRVFSTDAADRAAAGPMVRFHVGLEHVDDLIGDMESAFTSLSQSASYASSA